MFLYIGTPAAGTRSASALSREAEGKDSTQRQSQEKERQYVLHYVMITSSA